MRFWFQILLITGITVGLGGCDALSGFLPGGDGGEDVTTTEGTQDDPNVEPNATDPNVDPNATDPNAAVDPNAPADETDTAIGTEDIEEPVIVGNVSGDLIQSTSPEERVRQVQRDRPDPFDILGTTPTIEVPADALSLDPQDTTVDNSNIGNPTDPNGVDPVESDNDTPSPALEPIEPPPPPEPATARAVAVTGVVQIGSVPYAIVNAPNEPHSRYVRSGQLLSNGQVLVKRIELFSGIADPVVVLEEFGIEVNRQVGDNPEATDDPPTPEQVDV